MFRKATFAEEEDSDHSISEEEEFTPNWPANCVPLGETAEQKGGIQIQSQLDLLRDSHQISHGTEVTSILNKGQAGFSSEDDVDVPFFQDVEDSASSPEMACTSNLNEDIISDNEIFGLEKLGSQNPNEACTWSAINEEAEALVHINENARSSSMHLGSSYAKKPHKGSRDKAKARLLFRFQSNAQDTSSAFGCKNDISMSSSIFPLIEERKGVDNGTIQNVMAESLIEEEIIEQLSNSGAQTEPIFACGHTKESMIDLLDSYQDMVGVPKENIEMMVDEGKTSPIDERKLDHEEPPETLDSESSTDDETYIPMNVQNLGLVIHSTEKKTMTDKFEEIFGGVTANEEVPEILSHGIGVFGKLQQVMQSEKKREMEFLKRKQTDGNSEEETSCIDVEILSRCLEAKLVVCRCSLSQEKEYPNEAENSHAKSEDESSAMTVIFSHHVCDDVDLEVGNLIRIYSPWREVQVGERDEMIILSSFFSQI